jgi:4-hydroxy-tetrahydrodipicolinate reductase
MSATPLRTVITGVTGRMGALVTRMVRDAPDFVVHAGVAKPGSAVIGLDVGLAAHLAPLGVTTSDSLSAVLERAQVVIDFTTPAASVAHAKLCAAAGVPLIVGSTGFSPEASQQIHAWAKSIPVVMSPNMSIGVNLVVDMASALALQLGEDFDVEIVETHHRMKKDAPSGTALRLAEQLANALGREKEDICTARVGQVGERRRGEIGVQALRGGDVVGEHTVFFFGEGERVELTHRATSREQFGRGALRAARWLVGQAPGLYDMRDVLGLK